MAHLVSVIMPVFNAQEFIAESIDSVIRQTYGTWELIVVDDGSTDQTASVVKTYQENDSRIKYLWQNNGKQGKARNFGILNSHGEILAFLDADDLWLPGKLQGQVYDLEVQHADLVFGYSWLLKNGAKTQEKIGRGCGKYKGAEAIGFLLYHDAFIMSTVCVLRERLLSVNAFNEDPEIQYCEDWHLWLKLAFEGCTFYTDAKEVSYYRISGNSSTSTEQKAQVKFFRALIDLNMRYPERLELIEEIERRIPALIYHEPDLNVNLVRIMLGFLKKVDRQKINSRILMFVFKLNTALFRKLFFLIYRKPRN